MWKWVKAFYKTGSATSWAIGIAVASFIAFVVHYQELRIFKAECKQIKPILINADGTIADGLARARTAVALGINVLCEDNESTRAFQALTKFKSIYPLWAERTMEYLEL